MGRSFLLTVRYFSVAYGSSLLLTVNLVWPFLLKVEIRFGLFCLQLSPVRNSGLVFFAYGSPTVSKKTNRK